MAEPIVLEFDLTPEALLKLTERKYQKVGILALLACYLLLGVLMVALHDVPFALVFFLVAAVFAAACWKMPQIRRNAATRLAGSTTVRFSDWGMEFNGSNVAERVPWDRFRRVISRPRVWVFQTKIPVAVFIVPKYAVPPQTREQFAAQLQDWSGVSSVR